MEMGSLLYYIIMGILDCWVGIALYVISVIKKDKKIFYTGLIFQILFIFGNAVINGATIRNSVGFLFFFILTAVVYAVFYKKMKTPSKTRGIWYVVSGIAFLILGTYRLSTLFTYAMMSIVPMYFQILTCVSMTACFLLSALSLMERKNMILCAALAVESLRSILSVVGALYTAYVISDLFVALSFITCTIVVAKDFLPSSHRKHKYNQKLKFVPAILYLISLVLNFAISVGSNITVSIFEMAGLLSLCIWTTTDACKNTLKIKSYEETKESVCNNVATDERNNNDMQVFPIYIFDMSTHMMRKETRNINVKKFPISKYADNNTYYAIETFRDGKKVRIYYTKNDWNQQIELGISK